MRRLALLAMLLAAPLSAQMPNLLPNPGFEELDGDRPAGWSLQTFRTGGEGRVETGGAHGGERSAALRSLDSTHRLARYNTANVPLPAGTRYVAAGGWYRTEGIEPSNEKRGACFRVHFYGNQDGRMQELGLRQDFFPVSETWTKTPERIYPLPAGTERVALQVFNWLTPGITRWDDVWLRAVDEQEFNALPDDVKLELRPIPTVTLEAEAARVSPERAEVVAQDSFPSKQGVSLKDGQATRVGDLTAPPDLVFPFTATAAGRYRIQTHAAVDAKGLDAMRRARGKQDSLYLQLAIGDGRRTQRVVFVPWSAPQSCTQTLGKFTFSGEAQEIAVWLPEGVRLDFLRIAPYVPPKVPDAVQAYRPTIVPPPTRPRLWLNADSLPRVRANLDRGENAAAWAKLRAQAERPVEFKVEPGTEVSHNSGLESAAVAKAFVSLMTGDEALGREAIRLLSAYLPALEFGNLLDITREIGRAIYSAALVYDWCYGLMSAEDRELLRTHMMRLADDMEIGWPPFLQMIVNGHGNEAQVNRDLLALSIALYDEDPVPYQYCAYRILEELVPMRRFEYQSPRHNQGASYGPFRYSWDLHAALLFWRMTGQKVFDDNLGGVYQQWLYMRTPGHRVLRDGDGFAEGAANYGLTPLLNYAYTGNPVVKWDFVRTGGLNGDALMVLLLNDPDLKPAAGPDELPLTKDFGPILGSMIARTGWNMGRNTGDVVVEMKGGGYNFGNHQHADAGSFQIYWRGLQAVDLGQYRFYGTPYDSNFTKRSIAHSLMLVVDPAEKFAGTTTNDGGTRSVRACPVTPEQATSDPLFANGKVLSASFGPDAQRPFFSHFAVDLDSAYSDKIQGYVRSFCFLNLDRPDTPAALILLDTLTSADPAFRKHWQINTLNAPELTAEGATLRNSDLGLNGRVDLRMLRPRPDERTAEVLSGPDANSVFGTRFEAPFPDRPEANGHRLMISPKTARADDTFLTVLTMADENAPALPVNLAENDDVFTVTLADRAVVLGRGQALLNQGFTVDLPPGERWQLLLTGLAPGTWSLANGQAAWNLPVEAGRHTAFALVPGGRWDVKPAPIAGAQAAAVPAGFVPAPSQPINDRVYAGGAMLPDVRVRTLDGQRLLPARAVGEALGLTVTETPEELRLSDGARTAVLRAGEAQVTLNDRQFPLPAAARREGEVWLVPAPVLAALAGRGVVPDEATNSVEFSREPRPWPAEVLWIESGRPADLNALHALLAAPPGNTEYWAVEGREVIGFTVTLRQPTRIAGVGIQWHQGQQRQAKFAIETSLDGETWQRVFEGTSSGKSAGLESYPFAAHEARFVRFVGFGNSANAWNSLVRFQIGG